MRHFWLLKNSLMDIFHNINAGFISRVHWHIRSSNIILPLTLRYTLHNYVNYPIPSSLNHSHFTCGLTTFLIEKLCPLIRLQTVECKMQCFTVYQLWDTSGYLTQKAILSRTVYFQINIGASVVQWIKVTRLATTGTSRAENNQCFKYEFDSGLLLRLHHPSCPLISTFPGHLVAWKIRTQPSFYLFCLAFCILDFFICVQYFLSILFGDFSTIDYLDVTEKD